MKSISLIFFVLMATLHFNQESVSKHIFFNASNPTFSYYGRVLHQDDTVGFIGSASSVEFQAKGDAIKIHLQPEYKPRNYVVLTLDGVYKGRLKLEGDSLNKLAIPLPDKKFHTIGIYKGTEAASGMVLFHGVEAEAISKVENDTAFTIEFIGDSITCGALMDPTDVPCDAKGEYIDQHNAYLAYGPIVARTLNADYILSSVSGMGIYRNWNDEHKDEPIMPEVYENLFLNTNDDVLYDFKVKPKLVSICLGTNDMSEGDGIKDRLPFNPETYVTRYIELVGKVYKHYPNTQVVLLNSPMIQGDKNDVLIDCLTQVKTHFEKDSDRTIPIFQFHEVYANGCSYHPSIADNKVMAEKLIPFFKKVLAN
ncbi:GDSL-type esterase/lipase family protein [Mangrovimonas sp. AS39]|uniref:SGNH/GDSL hydrolase family protein n=1 Tax=Mangrovimonas futianensis TaxID=2895523 RepID=UPI001E49C0E0|nr:SGNH/GDSL hydrolase family protein [Mangrovimonas futianensis]MCF1192311.1 GDSL-type esterase/lipase family protein [Mangrovimonas futianensis]MCF1195940.1 GDSL-type esterase/lipase family protein [Mangrovimonas futianensis]